jgi:ligand-binding SRPBCC domain-containing protein
MRSYNHRVIVNSPRDRVVEFHRDARALKRLTMPPVWVQIHSVEPISENSKADFTLWLGPIPVRWVALHSLANQVDGFTDIQIRGPFTRWVHRHRFLPINEYTTEIVDEIEAELGSNLINKLIGWFMWVNLPIMFSYRGWIIKRYLEGKP